MYNNQFNDDPFESMDSTDRYDGLMPTASDESPARDSGAPRKSRKTLFRCLGAGALAVVAAGAVVLSSAFSAPASAETGLASLSYASVSDRAVLTAAEVYARNVDSTVGITTSVTTKNYFGYDTTTPASGSGFIVTEDGYIITNYHVVEDSQDITVTLHNDETYAATLVGYDKTNDIAILKVDASGLQPVTFGDSDKLVVGEDVVAIGNPLGELTFSLTRGVVSALGREITLDGQRMKLIQTDCAINPGNSGGALFNMYGEVVGITNAKSSSSGTSVSLDNISFAIPVDSITSVAEQIMTTGKISTPYIGVTVRDVSSEMKAYGLPEGAGVYTVTEDSPAEKAGLKENDIITEADGHAITGKDDLVDYIRTLKADDELELTVYRQGETIKLTVTVSEDTRSALPEPEPEDETTQQTPDQQIITLPGFGDIFRGWMF